MQVYEIKNPSDQALVLSDDELVACIGVLLLGEGHYGLVRCSDGATVLPIFLFGGDHEWLVSKGIVSPHAKLGDGHVELRRWVVAHAAQLADMFDSVFYGSESELRGLESALKDLSPNERVLARQRYNEERRSSLNNIAQTCLWWSAKCRELASADKTAESARG